MSDLPPPAETTVPVPLPSDTPSPFWKWLKGMIRGYKTDTSLREALEEYIQATPEEGTTDITIHERLMLANVLKMRDLRVVDVMIPRADIFAVDVDITHAEFFSLLAEKQFSRIPVYHNTLDEVIGTIHIKDVLSHLAQNRPFEVKELVRDVPFVSPALPISDLVMQMRENKKHMVMVVDEYGGIDGLVTIGDVIETIFGQIGDEHDTGGEDMILPRSDGSVIIDARLSLIDFENHFGVSFDETEHEDNNTLAGLIFSIAGHVPARGEIVRHEAANLKFEVIDSDSRRVYRVRLANPPVVAPPVNQPGN